MIYIIAYDIADNKRRLRVAKTLESWCYRIQESVFQLRLDAATLARVRMSLAALISDAEDVIHIYPICHILRRPRRHTWRGHGAGRCGVVPGSVVRGNEAGGWCIPGRDMVPVILKQQWNSQRNS